MKIYFKSKISNMYHKRGILTQYDIGIRKSKSKNKKRALNILYSFKNKALNGFKRKNVNTKKFSENLYINLKLLDYEKIELLDYENLINSLYDLTNKDKYSLLDSFLTSLCLSVVRVKKESIHIYINKLEAFFKLCVKHEKIYGHDYIANVDPIFFNNNIDNNSILLYENMMLKMINNNDLSTQTALNLSFEILHLLSAKTIMLLLKGNKYPAREIFAYMIINKMSKENKDLNDSIIEHFKYSKRNTELYYVCLIRNIDSSILLEDINLSVLLKRLVKTKNSLLLTSTKKIEDLISLYLKESKNNKDYLNRMLTIADLFNEKKELFNKLSVNFTINDF